MDINALYRYLVRNGYIAQNSEGQIPADYGQYMVYDGGIIGITEAGDDPTITYDGGTI
jgi:hypothetical protein